MMQFQLSEDSDQVVGDTVVPEYGYKTSGIDHKIAQRVPSSSS